MNLVSPTLAASATVPAVQSDAWQLCPAALLDLLAAPHAAVVTRPGSWPCKLAAAFVAALCCAALVVIAFTSQIHLMPVDANPQAQDAHHSRPTPEVPLTLQPSSDSIPEHSQIAQNMDQHQPMQIADQPTTRQHRHIPGRAQQAGRHGSHLAPIENSDPG